MIFYDFEVTRYDWLVVCIDLINRTVTVIENNPKQLEEYYTQHKNDIWIGYNSRHYDQYILKAILCGFDAWAMNDWIINQHKSGWEFSKLLNKIQLINYDVAMLGNSLKQLEAFQGHNIHESSIDFRINRKLTREELDEMIKYCTNDVEETINIWAEKKEDFEAQLGLLKMFELPLTYMSKTKAQLTAEILECERQDFNDEWDLFTLKCLNLNNPKYVKVKDWFLDKSNHDYSNKLELNVCGVPHIFGWGGIHGALEKYHYRCKPNEIILHIDVASYYPSLMIFWDLLTRASKNPKQYKFIYDLRLKLKHEGKKKEQAPLKIVLNGTYGICKDKNSKAYDPRNANLICINGQLLLLDLLEKLENIPTFELIQSNTDGLIIKIDRRYFDDVDDVCYEWEQRTKMGLEFDYIKEIWQKDVNNYVFVQYDGKVERKGGYVKELSKIDNDLPIVNKALVDYMLTGATPEETINKCNDLIMYQKVCKLTNKFDYVTHNGKRYYNKCYRVFASNDDNDDTVYKVKNTSQYFKFGNTSEFSFIENGDIRGVKVPKKLDKNWYIDLAYKRLTQYGIQEAS